MNQKLVSIVTPTYNCELFISLTIKSVLDQTYDNWEMLIIDDYSTDNTSLKVYEFMKNDRRIQYHKLDSNQGAAMARNYGVERAKGEFIAFLDSDDLWSPEKLEKQISFMETNNYNFTCTDYDQIDESGNYIGKTIKAVKKANYNRVLLDCPIGNSSVIYNAFYLGKVYTPNIRKRNDDALWLKILKQEKFIYGFNERLMHYRIRKNSISRNKIELIKYHWELYRKVEKLSVFKSIFHIAYWIIIKTLKIK